MCKAAIGSGGVVLLAFLLSLPCAPSAHAVTVMPGDLIVTDFNGRWGGPVDSSLPGGRIVRVDPTTGAQTLISYGGLLDGPQGVVIDAAGNIILNDTYDDQLIKVNPADGSQTLIPSGGLFVDTRGITIDAAGDILVADFGYGGSGAIIRVDPATGAQTVAASGGIIQGPLGVTLDGAGNMYMSAPPLAPSKGVRVVKVDPVTGTQTLISSGGPYSMAFGGGIVVDATGRIFVTEQYYYNGVFEISPIPGPQSILVSGSPFEDPYDLAIDLSGDLIVADSNWHWEGRLIRVDPDTMVTTVISSGGLLIDPNDVAIATAPIPEPISLIFFGTGVVGVFGFVARKRMRRS